MSKGRRVPPAGQEPPAGDLENLMDADLEEEDPPKTDMEITSGVSFHTLEGYVQFSIGGRMFQDTPAEARMHALILLEAAEAAESEAITVAFARSILPVSDPLTLEDWQKIAQILHFYRQFRGHEEAPAPPGGADG